MTRVVAVLVGVCSVLAAQPDPQPDQDVRRAITRALAPLQLSATAFVQKRACVSCHHNSLALQVFHAARGRGFDVNLASVRAVELKTFRELGAFDEAAQSAGFADPTPNESTLLMAAGAAGVPPNLVMEIYARRMASWQHEGHWSTSDFRPPHSSSVFTATATAVRAIRLYMPPELRSERDVCIARARQWLTATVPVSTEDAAFRLLGLVWARADAAAILAARRDLLALQIPSGGWSQLPRYPADAYSTGEAVYALRESGQPIATLKTAVKFLLSTQALDGTWRTRTRMLSPAEVSPKYFTTGFPYQKDEYISYAGSCWAVMALVSMLPATKPPLIASGIPVDAPSWARTALFGSAGELAGLLDGGLDPNSKTSRGGTSVLMMAAANADKVKLLLSRGASTSGALPVAASYRGTAESLQALLDAGVDPKERNPALVFASKSGDLDNVKLLLARGADASPGLSEAITFDRPDVVEALIAAGASTGIRERTGINLLHWATITNRPRVIPLLAAAEVPLNAVDDYGYTPLMYAATIDFGDTAVLDALLKAGADRKIKNDDERTPLEQARFLHHVQLEKRLAQQ